MGLIRSFQVPYRDKLFDAIGMMSEPWTWFFRSLFDRVYPLGEELTERVLNAAVFDSSTDVNTSTDVITETAHGLSTGVKGQLTTTGTLPTGLSLATDYFIIKTDANSFQLATSLANAEAGTNIDITGAGSGTHTFTPTVDLQYGKLNSKGITCAILEYLVQRITTGGSAQELTEFGIVTFVYNPTSANWSTVVVTDDTPDNSGITFSISSTGQIQYSTVNVTGTPSISQISYRFRTLKGANTQYSSQGSR